MLNFRKALIEDLPDLLKFEQCVIEAERPYNSSIKAESAFYYDIENLILSDDSYLLVAETEDEIIGTGYAQIRNSKISLDHERHAYLGFMYVSPAHRGKGINSKLIEKLIAWGKQNGVQDFYLDVYSQNSSAIKAYEKVGFKPSLMEMKFNLK
ncbi:GNAT family N-acetyltransferase [Microbulbifer sp. VAAF005]|uniref:GNAT family N-acetyltransferase n=1 Tax=Microbulbifer sp. VAAF005 TaxID=3034230 RepID=UPI0024AD91FE|nr:GNAT family N-acetyltransferase [Microbulbifer sp. VAAF005]WHI46072.1 GNAT family N-acetyltransferase [Microbulbifer sp. VAAF005]